MAFEQYFVQDTLKEANEFKNDGLLATYYIEIAECDMQIRRLGQGRGEAKTDFQSKMTRAKANFLQRLEDLKQDRKSSAIEQKNQEREQKLLDLQKEVADLAKRGHKLTLGATLFAAAASLLGVGSIIVASLQMYEAREANRLMNAQNEIMIEQNKIAERCAPTPSK